MLCENCGNNEANVKYTQVINGVKKQMNLCEHCANKMGINNISFSMPISLFNFMEDMFEPQMVMQKSLIDDFFDDEFEMIQPRLTINTENKRKLRSNNTSIDEIDEWVRNINKKIDKADNKIENLKSKLQKRLEKEIKEERYEDAAKTRDEIKKIEE